MDIGEIIGDAIRYPSQDWTKVLILGVFTILNIIIIGILFVPGYLLRVLKATLAGSDELPEFGDWGDMIIDSLKVIIVYIGYFIIPIIIGIIAQYVFMASYSSTIESSMMTTGAVPNFGAIFGPFMAIYAIEFILGIIFGAVFLMAIANMAYYDGDIGAAFRFSEILDLMKSVGYANYIIWIIVMAIAGVVIYVISLITMVILIGFILAPLVIAPYAAMFFARSLGLLVTSVETVTPEERYASPGK